MVRIPLRSCCTSKDQEQLLCASKSVVLESDLRAEKRREFDRFINERMNELALIQIQISEQRARQQWPRLCFKAAPLPQPFADPFPSMEEGKKPVQSQR
jgi:hypothetical protein